MATLTEGTQMKHFYAYTINMGHPMVIDVYAATVFGETPPAEPTHEILASVYASVVMPEYQQKYIDKYMSMTLDMLNWHMREEEGFHSTHIIWVTGEVREKLDFIAKEFNETDGVAGEEEMVAVGSLFKKILLKYATYVCLLPDVEWMNDEGF